TGVAVTFVDWDDIPRWGLINKTLDLGIPEPQETYSSSPHLYADLDIPTGTTGMLPVAARTRAGLGAERVEDLGETGKGRGPRGGGSGAGSGAGRGRGGRGESRGRGGRDQARGLGEPRGQESRGRDDSRGDDGASSATSPANQRSRRNRRRTRGGRPAGEATTA
ncbi:MAG: DEAD/DEAH box helicase, partial [Phycicoccus sp.]